MKQGARFGRWLGETRRAAQLTQAQLAEVLGVEQPTISYWESEGREWMEPEEIRALARAVRVEPVEVADALGYPTRPRASVTLPISEDRWIEAVADLNHRVQETQERWAEDVFPPQSEERGQNGRSG